MRKGDTGSWQYTVCHLTSAFVKQDELKPVIKIKEYKLFFNLFGLGRFYYYSFL